MKSPQALPVLQQVRRIWDRAEHNAFTDLHYFAGRWWCVFREGSGHMSPDGHLRLLVSLDGNTWESAAQFSRTGEDLRDGKLSQMPDGRLMLIAAGAIRTDDALSHQTYAWFSQDGYTWSPPSPICDPDYWLWRVSWYENTCLGIAYRAAEEMDTRLYRSNDGLHFEPLVSPFVTARNPNESAIIFLPDGHALTLLRRNNGGALLGMASPPYRDWRWRNTGTLFGGPQLLRLPDGRVIAGGRRVDDGRLRTSLCWVDPATARLEEFLCLPSGGDNSYPGLWWKAGTLWVSYYSSHEEKTAIYLAQVDLPLT